MADEVRFTDLSIHIRMAYNRQHILNGGPKDAVVPGWFLHVSRNEGYDIVVNETPLTTEEMLVLSREIDRILSRQRGIKEGMLLPSPVTNAVQTAAQKQRDTLVRQLKAAEDAAARIPALRAQLENRA